MYICIYMYMYMNMYTWTLVCMHMLQQYVQVQGVGGIHLIRMVS